MNRFTTVGLGLALAATPLVATAGTAGASTAERSAAPAFSVSASISQTTSVANEDVVKIRGKVSPKAAGEKVVLQQRMDGNKTWKKSGTAKIKPTGKFVLKDDPSAAGTRYYRVLKPASGAIKKGVSKELELVVYAWEKLAYRASGPKTNVSFQSAVIETDTYAASIVNQEVGVPAAIEYTLGKKCLLLRSTYALTDSTVSGGTGMVALKADGALAFASGLVLGQAIKDHEVSVKNVFRIGYELNPGAGSFVAVATPEVLCTK